MYTHNIIKASFLFLLRGDCILFSKRKNTVYFDGFISVPSGNVEKGETFLSAIIREAHEELDICLDKIDLIPVHIMHRITQDDESINVFFTSNSWKGNILNKEPDKCVKVFWSEINILPKNIIPFLSHAITCYRNKEYFSEVRL